MRPVVSAESVIARLAGLRSRATERARAGAYDEAVELFDAAFVLAEATGEGAAAAEALAGLAWTAHLRGDLASAADLYARAESALAARGDAAEADLARCRLGFLHYDRGDLDAAESHLYAALARARDPRVRGRARGYLGNVARARGEHTRALRCYDEAVTLVEDAGDVVFAATFAMDRAVTLLLGGGARGAARAANDFDDLRATSGRDARLGDGRLVSLVDHYAALARFALGAPDPRRGDVETKGLPIAPFLARARGVRPASARAAEEIADLRASAPEDAHARITLEIVERAVRERAETPPSRGLTVSRSGTFFRLRGGEPVVLSQRAPLTRLVAALAAARIDAPGRFVDESELAEAAWPGEKLLPAARKNRLHVALATLRKEGLRPVLERDPDGARYRLAPDAELVLVE